MQFFPASAEFFSSWFTVLHNVSFGPCFSFISGLFCRFVAVFTFCKLIFYSLSV